MAFPASRPVLRFASLAVLATLPAWVSCATPTTPCVATEYSQIAPAVASCTAITLSNIYAPPNSSIELVKLKTGATVTFEGTTTFGFTNSTSFNPIYIDEGVGVTITGAPGSVINGSGGLYWDGQGSNGGVPKPDHFIVVDKLTGGSVISDLNIVDWPTHCFDITNSADLTLQDLVLDNRAGDAPNARSSGLAAAHNTDGFDISGSTNVVLQRAQVWNQDDCVAVTSGDAITVCSMYCSGSHGLSVGSVGGKSDNNVTNVVFSNATLVNNQNGARIKTNYGDTGYVANITYSGITVANASDYGIDIQQDYLNGGPTGDPSNGILIQNVLFQNIHGTVQPGALDYYVLCGQGSCQNVTFQDVDVTGSTDGSSCNYPPEGCPA